MELFQELLFTIFFSIIVSLLIAKLFSMTSSYDDGNSTVSKRVEDKIEKEWIVCDSEKEEKASYFEDAVEVSEEVVYGYVEAKLGSGCVMEDPKTVGEVGASFVFDESPEINDAAVVSVKSGEDNVGQLPIQDTSRTESDLASGTGSSIQEDCIEVQQESSATDVDDDAKIEEKDEILYDDWQGIETTELEKSFGAAVAFMGSRSSADRVSLIDNEVKVQLYGLHKVALEGPCFESQPMALKVSARANWNAWKRLENLGREDAMAQYIALISQHVPDWMGSHACEDDMVTAGKLPLDVETQTGGEGERIVDQVAVEESNIIIREKQ